MFDYLVCGLGSVGSEIAKLLKLQKKKFNVLENARSLKSRDVKKYSYINSSELNIKKPLLVFVCYPDLIAAKKEWAGLFDDKNVFFVCMTGWPILYGTWPIKSNILMYAPKAIASKITFGGCVFATSFYKKTNDSVDPFKELNQIFQPKKTIEASPAQELCSDLLSEQLLLCGWGPLISLLTYKKLLKFGVPKELAWEECTKEAAYIFNTLASLGPEGFSKKISDLALRGGYRAIKKFPIKQWNEMVDKMYEDIKNEKIFKKTDDVLPTREDAKKFWEDMSHE